MASAATIARTIDNGLLGRAAAATPLTEPHRTAGRIVAPWTACALAAVSDLLFPA